MGGSRSVDRRQIRGYMGASGDRGSHGSHRRFGSARRICGLGGRPNPGGARCRANNLVRTAYRGGLSRKFLRLDQFLKSISAKAEENVANPKLFTVMMMKSAKNRTLK